MADEPLPKPENIKPAIRPIPSYSQDVIYAGASPAPARPESITAGSPVAESTGPARSTPPSRSDLGSKTAWPHRSEINLFFSWLAGVFILLPCWAGGLSFFCFYATRWAHLTFIHEQVAGWIGFFLSFVFLFLLERNLWLSRFMGLRLGPYSTQTTETLFFFITGIVGLLLRSSDKPAPVASRSMPENDGTREIVETVVFVVVLVLLLKTFLVEAFVIPTGSMADTLLGYHKDYTCEKCLHRFVVNCSTEAEPQPGRDPDRIIGGICPNCRHPQVRK